MQTDTKKWSVTSLACCAILLLAIACGDDGSGHGSHSRVSTAQASVSPEEKALNALNSYRPLKVLSLKQRKNRPESLGPPFKDANDYLSEVKRYRQYINSMKADVHSEVGLAVVREHEQAAKYLRWAGIHMNKIESYSANELWEIQVSTLSWIKVNASADSCLSLAKSLHARALKNLSR